jgi:hypothetical protein
MSNAKIQMLNEFQMRSSRPQTGASRKAGSFYIVLLGPAYKAGLEGHVPAKISDSWILVSLFEI